MERLRVIAALPEPHEAVGLALARLEADAKAKAEVERREAEARQAHLAAAISLAQQDRVEEAAREMQAAEAGGADVTEAKRAIDDAPSNVKMRQEVAAKEAAAKAARDAEFKRHVQQARALVKKNDADGAMAEVEKAEAIAGGSGSLKELREAIAQTPTARRRERIRQAEERRAEQKRIREARVAARSEALRTLCDLGAERQRDMQEISMEQAGACGGSGMSPGAFQCNNRYENAKMRVMSRYEARMARFRTHAEQQLGRSLTQRDCCAALPSRYQFYGDNCIQSR